MKIFLIVFVSLLLVGGVIGTFVLFLNKDDSIYVDKLNLSKNEINLEVDQTFDINNILKIEPYNYNVSLLCYVENTNFVNIIENNKIVAKRVGSTNVIIKSLQDKNTIIDAKLKVNVVEKTTYPNSLSFEQDLINMGLNTSACVNRLISDIDFTASISIEYSVENICTYNYESGIITPLNYGTCEVFAKIYNGTNVVVSASFTVDISRDYRSIVIENGELINGEYVVNINKDEVSRIYINAYDDLNVDLDINYSVSILENDANVQIINCDYSVLRVVAGTVGESLIKVSCEDDDTIFVLIRLIVE